MKNTETYNTVALNCARNCLRYVIRAFNIKEIYVPFYTCLTVWQAVKKENCKINFYHTDKNFMPCFDFPDDAFILYNNYFGVCSGNVKELSGKYKNLIVDNAQAFFMPPIGIASFNSARKFFNVSDGAFLYTKKLLNNCFDTDVSAVESSKLTDYRYFSMNEESFDKRDIMYMPDNTNKQLSLVDYEREREERKNKFSILSEKLKTFNELSIELSIDDVPMYYPLLTRNTNIENLFKNNDIKYDKLWNDRPDNEIEGIFSKYLLLIPLHKGYSEKYMYKIIGIVDKIR